MKIVKTANVLCVLLKILVNERNDRAHNDDDVVENKVEDNDVAGDDDDGHTTNIVQHTCDDFVLTKYTCERLLCENTRSSIEHFFFLYFLLDLFCSLTPIALAAVCVCVRAYTI